VPRVVPRDQLTAASALLSLSSNASFILGSALGGVIATWPGPQAVYLLDVVSFAISLGFLAWLGPLPAPAAAPERAGRAGLGGLLDGLRYARGRPELVGSYLVDLAAMTFAFPNALFPFVAARLHAPWAVGLMFAAPSAGADMLSGIFRDTLWNQTIPDALRGRLAGLELLSYGLGPSAGQIRAGAVAGVTSPQVSLVSGGLACLAAVALTCATLPGLVAYDARRSAR
jgi:hypothetical protein